MCSALRSAKRSKPAESSAVPLLTHRKSLLPLPVSGAPRDPSFGPAAASPSASSPAGHVCPVPSSLCSRAARTHTLFWCLTPPGPRLASKVLSPSPRRGAAAQPTAHTAEQQPVRGAGQTPAHCPTVSREPWSLDLQDHAQARPCNVQSVAPGELLRLLSEK